MANSLDPDQLLNQDLHCLLRCVCPNAYEYDIWQNRIIINLGCIMEKSSLSVMKTVDLAPEEALISSKKYCYFPYFFTKTYVVGMH